MNDAWVLALLVCGCASQPAPIPAAPAPVEPSSEGWTTSSSRSDGAGALYDDSGRPLVSNTVTFDAPAEDRFATRSIGPTKTPAPARPPRVGKRNIALKHARLDNAMRMLAKVGRFNLVVQGDIAVPVTVNLEAVEPFDAAIAIAEANHVSLRYRDGIVIVAKSTK